jgi:hypothetical protein
MRPLVTSMRQFRSTSGADHFQVLATAAFKAQAMRWEKGPPTRRPHAERRAFSLTCRSASTSELAFSIGVLVTHCA